MIDAREHLADLLYEAQYRHMFVEETVDLLQDHGVIYPPCKVGDKVYSIGWLDGKVHEEKVSYWSYNSKEDLFWFVTDATSSFSSQDIGVCEFFSREEAEQALKECDT